MPHVGPPPDVRSDDAVRASMRAEAAAVVSAALVSAVENAVEEDVAAEVQADDASAMDRQVVAVAADRHAPAE